MSVYVDWLPCFVCVCVRVSLVVVMVEDAVSKCFCGPCRQRCGGLLCARFCLLSVGVRLVVVGMVSTAAGGMVEVLAPFVMLGAEVSSWQKTTVFARWSGGNSRTSASSC